MIENESCVGWKACYESAGAITVQNGSCQEAHACAEMRGEKTIIK